MNENSVSPAGLITEVRLALGLSEECLASKLGVGINQISLWESGKALPSQEIITRLEGMVALGRKL